MKKIDLKIVMICLVVILIASSYHFYRDGYKKGYRDGANYGYVTALDTVKNICQKQQKTDTIVSKLVMITDKDTVAYILSKKTVFKK